MCCNCHHSDQQKTETRRRDNVQFAADLIAIATRLAAPTVITTVQAKYISWKAFRKNPTIDLKL